MLRPFAHLLPARRCLRLDVRLFDEIAFDGMCAVPACVRGSRALKTIPSTLLVEPHAASQPALRAWGGGECARALRRTARCRASRLATALARALLFCCEEGTRSKRGDVGGSIQHSFPVNLGFGFDPAN